MDARNGTLPKEVINVDLQLWQFTTVVMILGSVATSPERKTY